MRRVPVEMPEGVSYEGVFGSDKDASAHATNGVYAMRSYGARGNARTRAGLAQGVGGGVGSGAGGGGGTYATKIAVAPASPPLSIPGVMEPAIALSTRDQKPTGEQAVLEAKLHPALVEAFECWKNSKQNCKLVKDGVVELQVWLTDDSQEVLDRLKALGFTISEVRPKEKVVVGRLPAERLAELAKMSPVRFASPVRR
jgi:hypothetical protein